MKKPPFSHKEGQQICRDVLVKYRRFVSLGLAEAAEGAGVVMPEWEGEGAVVRDAAGCEYLDLLGGCGASVLGHRHPRILSAVKEQLDRLPLKTHLLLSQPVADLCALLAEVTPKRLECTFLCHSGSEAVEGALKAARLFTCRPSFVSAIGAFHGCTMGSLSACGCEEFKQPFHPLVPGFRHVPFGDIESLKEVVSEDTAAIVLEPIQAEGGVVVPPEDYLKQVRALCDEAGALLILDETHTAPGRLGRLFAAELYGVEPDILCLGSALGGGVVPVGAFIGRADIWDTLFHKNPFLHSCTLGGNSLAAVAAQATLRTAIEEKLPDRAADLGDRLMEGLKQIRAAHQPAVVAVRGKGLLAGIEFLDADLARQVVVEACRLGVLVAQCLNAPAVVRLEPPLTISEEDLQRALALLNSAITEATAHVQHLLEEE